MNNNDTEKDINNKENKAKKAFIRKRPPAERKTAFKDLKTAEKIDYIFDYYKIHIFSVICIILLVVSIVVCYRRNNYDTACSIVSVGGKITGYDDETDAITQGFTNYLGIDGKDTRVDINYDYTLKQSPLDQDPSISKAKIITLASTRSIDGYLADREYITFFCSDNEYFLEDLTEILSPDELKKIGDDNIVYYTTENGAKIPVAVDLSGTKIKEDTDLTTPNPCYGVIVSSPNKENAIAFIRYAFDL